MQAWMIVKIRVCSLGNVSEYLKKEHTLIDRKIETLIFEHSCGSVDVEA